MRLTSARSARSHNVTLPESPARLGSGNKLIPRVKNCSDISFPVSRTAWLQLPAKRGTSAWFCCAPHCLADQIHSTFFYFSLSTTLPELSLPARQGTGPVQYRFEVPDAVDGSVVWPSRKCPKDNCARP